MYEYRAIVKYVHDGDTVTLDIDQGFDHWHHNMHIRMYGIDAPELHDVPAGPVARDFLTALLPPGTVVMVRTQKDQADKYGGRYDGTILTGTWVGTALVDPVNLNDLMVASGHATPYFGGPRSPAVP